MRFSLILLFFLSIQLMPSERAHISAKNEIATEHNLLSSDYTQEIACQHRSNPIAESQVQPSIAPSTTTATPHRTPALRNLLGGSTMHATASGKRYCVNFNGHRLCKRAIEYYLYGLCVLRL